MAKTHITILVENTARGPGLLAEHGLAYWIERLGFGETETELYQRAFRRGLTRNDLIVGFVAPDVFDPEEEIEVASLHV